MFPLSTKSSDDSTTERAARPSSMPLWKRLVIISASAGAGLALAIALIVGGLIWYNSRPTPSQPWNRQAMLAKEPPGFTLSDDCKAVVFDYTLENTTNQDYGVENPETLRIMTRLEDKSLVGPLTSRTCKVDGPIFIPAHQSSVMVFDCATTGAPERTTGESEQDEHERLRAFLEERYGDHLGFSLFDEATHYEIDLPKWLAKKPEKRHFKRD